MVVASDVAAGTSVGDIANKLSDRLSTLVPPPAAAGLASPPRPSAAVQKALQKSAVLRASAARRANRNSGSMISSTVSSFTRACAFVPYALVALALRFVIARAFFLYGQTLVNGPAVPINVQDFEFSVTLPLEVKTQTFNMFLTQLAGVPVPPMLAAYLVSYAEFILPIFLVLGFATRFSALTLLIITAMIAYVAPNAMWSLHVYWAAILFVLISMGPGQISVDHVIRWIARR